MTSPLPVAQRRGASRSVLQGVLVPLLLTTALCVMSHGAHASPPDTDRLSLMVAESDPGPVHYITEGVPIAGSVQEGRYVDYVSRHRIPADRLFQPLEVRATWVGGGGGHLWVMASCRRVPRPPLDDWEWSRAEGSHLDKVAVLLIPSPHDCYGRDLYVSVYALESTRLFHIGFQPAVDAGRPFVLGRNEDTPESLEMDPYVLHLVDYSVPASMKNRSLDFIGFYGHSDVDATHTFSAGIYVPVQGTDTKLQLVGAVNQIPCRLLRGPLDFLLPHKVPLRAYERVYLAFQSWHTGPIGGPTQRPIPKHRCVFAGVDGAAVHNFGRVPRDEYRLMSSKGARDMAQVLDLEALLSPFGRGGALSIFTGGSWAT